MKPRKQNILAGSLVDHEENSVYRKPDALAESTIYTIPISMTLFQTHLEALEVLSPM